MEIWISSTTQIFFVKSTQVFHSVEKYYETQHNHVQKFREINPLLTSLVRENVDLTEKMLIFPLKYFTTVWNFQNFYTLQNLKFRFYVKSIFGESRSSKNRYFDIFQALKLDFDDFFAILVN